MSKLKRCPFCGGEAELKRGLTNLDNFVQCVVCGCRTKLHNTKKSAIKAWNTRKPMERIIERLKGFNGEVFISANGRANGKTLAYGYSKGIEKAVMIVKEEGGIND